MPLGLFRDYIHSVLRWIESQPDALVVVILVFLYTLVSLPIAWGYIIINIATGKHDKGSKGPPPCIMLQTSE